MDRVRNDAYPTPCWPVDRLLEAFSLDADLVLEPAAGSGNLIRWFRRHGVGRYWAAVEIDEQHRQALEVVSDDFVIGDYLTIPRSADAIVGNPPFSSAFEFAKKAIQEAPIVVLLLRLGFLSSGRRAPWLQQHTPSVYVLPERPGFVGAGTDKYDYAWFVWCDEDPIVRVLDRTRKQLRRARGGAA